VHSGGSTVGKHSLGLTVRSDNLCEKVGLGTLPASPVEWGAMAGSSRLEPPELV